MCLVQIDTECDFGYQRNWNDTQCLPIPGFNPNVCSRVRDRSYTVSESGLRLLNGDNCTFISNLINDTDGRGHSTQPWRRHMPMWLIVTIILMVRIFSLHITHCNSTESHVHTQHLWSSLMWKNPNTIAVSPSLGILSLSACLLENFFVCSLCTCNHQPRIAAVSCLLSCQTMRRVSDIMSSACRHQLLSLWVWRPTCAAAQAQTLTAVAAEAACWTL